MAKQMFVLGNIRGRNGTDPPVLLPNDVATEARNVDLSVMGVASKRNGSAAVSLTFASGGPFTAPLKSLIRHIPGSDETASELWAVDSTATPKLGRLTGAATWNEITVADAFTAADTRQVVGCSFNGKLFLAYNSAVNRLHVWDGTSLRRVGLATPGTVTAADSGSGTYTATLRYYKVTWVTQSSGVVVRRSEASAAASITPSGSGLGVVVSRPAVASESETHWETWGSADGTTYYLLGTRTLALSITAFADYSGTVAGTVKATTSAAHSLQTYETVTISGTTSYNGTFMVARISATEFYFTDTWVANDATGSLTTTTYYDDDAPASYSGTVIPLVGANTAPTSVRFIVTNGNRLLMAGAWEKSGSHNNSRVWFTPVLGASDVGDDERIPNTTTLKAWIDLDENDGGYITGMVGEFQGGTLVFKYRQLWKLTPTGNDTAPYRATKISNIIGAVSQKSIVEAEDENGNPAIYFLSQRGPYRYGSYGLEFVGHDVTDLWRTAQQNSTYYTTQETSHGVFHPKRRQVYWWYRVSGDSTLDSCFVLNVPLMQRTDVGVRGGWATAVFPGETGVASVMHSTVVGTTNSTELSPYVFVYTTGGSVSSLLKLDGTSLTQDGSTSYQGYVTSKALALGGIGKNFSVMEPQFIGTGGNGTVTITMVGSLGETSTGTVNFNSSTPVVRQADASQSNQNAFLSITIGDASAQSLAWSIHAMAVPYKVQEER